MLIQEAIDFIRHRIKETSDDSSYSDQYIYRFILNARNYILDQELNRKKIDNPLLWVGPICVPLCETTYAQCDCIPDLGCYILKTKFALPAFFATKSRLYLEVSNLNGETQYYYKEPYIGKYTKFKRTNQNKPYYFINNGFLYLANVPNNRLKVVLISFIPEDPTEVLNIPQCNEDGSTTNNACFSLTDLTLNVEGKLEQTILDLAFQRIAMTLSIGEDKFNDAVSNVQDKLSNTSNTSNLTNDSEQRN